MTLSYPMEIFANELFAVTGERINASCNNKFSFDYIKRKLEAKGYNPYCEYSMFSSTSEKFKTPIFMGAVMLQALKHHVLDKYQVRSRGSLISLYQQPPKGRKMGGGLRFGEMERDTLESHGSSAVMQERLKKTSDEYTVEICKACGHFVKWDNTLMVYNCPLCHHNAQVGTILSLTY